MPCFCRNKQLGLGAIRLVFVELDNKLGSSLPGQLVFAGYTLTSRGPIIFAPMNCARYGLFAARTETLVARKRWPWCVATLHYQRGKQSAPASTMIRARSLGKRARLSFDDEEAEAT